MAIIATTPTELYNAIREDANIQLVSGQTYNMHRSLNVINLDNVSITSENGDKPVLEFLPGHDGLIVKNSNDFTLRNIIITVKEDPSETYPNSALVMEECNYSSITNCVFNCTNRGYGFGIFLAGPNVNEGVDYNSPDYTDIISANTLVFYRKNRLMTGNVFNDNVVNCGSTQDGFSYSLQYRSEMKRNIINGTRIAVYMVKNCEITDNIVNDSMAQGVFISTPCRNIHFCNNEINRPKYDAIVVNEQGEHTNDELEDTINNNFQTYIQGNKITTAIEYVGNNNQITGGYTEVSSPILSLIGTRNVYFRNNMIITNGIGILMRGRKNKESDTYEVWCRNNRISGNSFNIENGKKVSVDDVEIEPMVRTAYLFASHSRNNSLSRNNVYCGVNRFILSMNEENIINNRVDNNNFYVDRRVRVGELMSSDEIIRRNRVRRNDVILL
jgi:hypothetical protein